MHARPWLVAGCGNNRKGCKKAQSWCVVCGFEPPLDCASLTPKQCMEICLSTGCWDLPSVLFPFGISVLHAVQSIKLKDELGVKVAVETKEDCVGSAWGCCGV